MTKFRIIVIFKILFVFLFIWLSDLSSKLYTLSISWTFYVFYVGNCRLSILDKFFIHFIFLCE